VVVTADDVVVPLDEPLPEVHAESARAADEPIRKLRRESAID